VKGSFSGAVATKQGLFEVAHKGTLFLDEVANLSMETQGKLLKLMHEKGARVLIMRQMCALSPERKGKKRFEMKVDEKVCIGENCGCSRLCTRIFRCPGLVWDKEKKTARIDEVICAGCGVCASICPSGAILKVEVA
jgi:indolepyruvate ferredoxin oxidoreductase alpha subunit